MESIETFSKCVASIILSYTLRNVSFYQRSALCSRNIFGTGIRFDIRRMEGLLIMEPPALGSDPQQFLCAMQWVKQGIQDLNKLIEPLHSIMKTVQRMAKSFKNG